MEDYDMRVVCAVSTAQELLDAAKDNSRSVYFLDVDLKDRKWDGFTLGRELLRRDPHGTLVYITSYGDLAWKTFQYHLEAFDYIIKEGDQTGSTAARCLEAVHARLLDERSDPVEVFSLRTILDYSYLIFCLISHACPSLFNSISFHLLLIAIL